MRENKTMRHIYIIKGIVAAAILTTAVSCVKDDLYEMPDPGQDTGTLVVTTDFTDRSAEAEFAPTCSLLIGSGMNTTVASGATTEIDSPMKPDAYSLLAYTEPEGFTVSGTVATVNALPGGGIEPQPGYLFAAALTAEIEAGKTTSVTARMRQYVRRIDFDMDASGDTDARIASASATLGGVETAVDLATGMLAGNASTVSADFTKGDDGHYRLFFRVLDIVSAGRQTLTVRINYINGDTQTVESDISDKLGNFSGSREPLQLNGELQLPVEAGANATLSPWTMGEGGSGDAM